MEEIIEEKFSKKCIKCHVKAAWRILLRSCGHVICVGCGLECLRMNDHKPRIKCPKKSCKYRIHENDIRALLDKRNPDLDPFMLPSQRDWLLFHHDQDVLRYALGGDQFSKQCPLCLNFYAKLDGCNYVRCANLRCNQWFCFNCGDPVDSWQHFTQNRCKVGWDDIFKLIYFLRWLLLAEAWTNAFVMPFLSIALLFFLPLYVMIGFPYYCLKSVFSRHRKSHGSSKKILLCIKVSIGFVFVVPIGFCIGLTSFATSVFLCLLYWIISVAKWCPTTIQILKVLDIAAMGLGVLGFGRWKQILQDAQAARMELKIDEKQEKSDELNSIEEEIKEARKDRAIGAAQCGDGIIDVGMVIKKGVHNVEALGKGNLKDIQLIKFKDIKVNNNLKLAGNLRKMQKATKIVKKY